MSSVSGAKIGRRIGQGGVGAEPFQDALGDHAPGLFRLRLLALGAHDGFAGGRQRRFGGARGTVRGGGLCIGAGQRVGGMAVRRFRPLHLVARGGAAGGDLRGSRGKRRQRRLSLGRACGEVGDAAARIVGAHAPVLAFGRQRAGTVGTPGGGAGQRVAFAPRGGLAGAGGSQRGAGTLHCGAAFGRIGQTLPGLLRTAQRDGGFRHLGVETGRLFLKRAQPCRRRRGLGGEAAGGRAGTFQALLGLSAVGTGASFGFSGGPLASFGLRARNALGGFGIGAHAAFGGLCSAPGLPCRGGLRLGCGKAAAQPGQPVALLQAHCGGGRRARPDGVAVPAPNRAGARHQGLAGPQPCLRGFGGRCVLGQPDLRQRAGERRRPLHEIAKCGKSGRQAGGSSTGGRSRQWRAAATSAAESSSSPSAAPERRLQACRHDELVDHAGPFLAVLDRQDFGERLRFRGQLGTRTVGARGTFAGGGERRLGLPACRLRRRLGRLTGGGGLRQCGGTRLFRRL